MMVNEWDLRVKNTKNSLRYEDEYTTLLLVSPGPTIDPQPYYVISVDVTYGCCSGNKFAIDKFSTLGEALDFQKTKESHATIDTAVIIKK